MACGGKKSGGKKEKAEKVVNKYYYELYRISN